MTRSRRPGLNGFLWLITVLAPFGLAASPASAASCRALIHDCQQKCWARYEPLLKKNWTVQTKNEETECVNACETRNYGHCE